MKLMALILFILTFISCGEKGPEKLSSIQISLNELQRAKSFQSLFSTPCYLPLETTDSSVIGNVNFIISSQFIQVNDLVTKNILIFNRKNGDFFKKIGKYGRGPEEYFYLNKNFYHFPPGYFISQNINSDLLLYDQNNHLERKISFISNDSIFEDSSFPSSFVWMSDTIMGAFYSNIHGTEKKRIVIYSVSGKVLTIFPNPNIIQHTQSYYFNQNDGIFYSYNNNTYFKEQRCDTVFCIKIDSLDPHFLINYGNLSKPYSQSFDFNDDSDHITQLGLAESSRSLYFLFLFYANSESVHHQLTGEYLCVYDKQKQQQQIYVLDQYHDVSKQPMDQIISQSLLHKLVAITDHYLVTLLSASEINEHFKEMEKNETWQQVKETDNPVLVFWYLPQ